MEKEFLKWKKNKVIKKCPRCKIYTEKNEGCNHMTCPNCQYQWCWICEEKYIYGHYTQGKCNGLQFIKADNIKDAKRIKSLRRENKLRNADNNDYYVRPELLRTFLWACCQICCLFLKILFSH